tara:strand:- start:860 stop:1537 length:678 start_codon:yes stop_codon:yes gene_type:complete
MSETTELVKRDEVNFVPLGESDSIKLSLDIIKRQIVSPTASGKYPSPKELTDMLMLCRARKLNPFTGDVYLVGYDSKGQAKFTLITSHMALLKRAEHSEQYDGMQSGLIVETENGRVHLEGDYIDPNQKATGAWARVYRKDQKVSTYRSLNISKYNKGFGLWKDNPEMMAVKCAEADALRSAFPSSAGGMYLREEMPQVQEKYMGKVETDDSDDGDLGPQRRRSK